jgi:hypothetical protein
MTRHLYTILLLVFSAIAVNAQLEINPTTLDFRIQKSSGDSINVYVTNTGNTEVNFWWTLNKDESWPSQWQSQVCDMNLCYVENIDRCSPSRPNTLAAGATATMYVKVLPDRVIGTARWSISIWGDANNTVLLARTDENGTVVYDPSTSTKNLANEEDLIIYPNPTESVFAIRNDSKVARVSILNVVGKEIRTVAHNRGTQHDVSNLNRGIYLVRLIDRSGKLIKTVRLSKK